jgi:NAD(P)-dependent dehydrogenase (short-subunit alcohol dehydrogenase family)
MKDIDNTIMQSMIDNSGARRIGTPGDITGAAAFLAGPDSAFITGNDILVDGGEVYASKWGTNVTGI